MEKQITINIPEGKEIKQEVDKDGNITIKFVDKVIIRSKSWEEYCKNHPLHRFEITEWQVGFGGQIDLVSTEYRFPNLLETKEDAEGILALIQLTRLHDEWVGDWKIDKFKSFWCISTCTIWDNATNIYEEKEPTTRFLAFPSKEMASEFEECFEDLLDKSRRFI